MILTPSALHLVALQVARLFGQISVHYQLMYPMILQQSARLTNAVRHRVDDFV